MHVSIHRVYILSQYLVLKHFVLCQELQSFYYEEKDYEGLPFDFYGGYIGYLGYVVNLLILLGALLCQ